MSLFYAVTFVSLGGIVGGCLLDRDEVLELLGEKLRDGGAKKVRRARRQQRQPRHDWSGMEWDLFDSLPECIYCLLYIYHELYIFG